MRQKITNFEKYFQLYFPDWWLKISLANKFKKCQSLDDTIVFNGDLLECDELVVNLKIAAVLICYTFL